MMEPSFEAHVQQIQQYLSLNLSESDTRVYLIDPLLHILGYKDVSNLRREVSIPATKETLDYELLIHGQPIAIIEAKALRHQLTDQHAAQCVQYASVLGVRWCLVTNGISWAIYDAHGKGPLAEKRIIEVALKDDNEELEQAWEVLSLFSQDALSRTDPLERLLVERVVCDELTHSSSPVVKALRRATWTRFGEHVSGEAVVAAAQRLLKKQGGDFKDAAHPAETSKTSAEAGKVNRRSTSKTPNRPETARRVTLSDIINAGLLPPDAVLQVKIQGVTHSGLVREGKIVVNDQSYLTPSAASIALRNVRSWNGWTDWKYKDETLARIRQRYENAKSPVAKGPS